MKQLDQDVERKLQDHEVGKLLTSIDRLLLCGRLAGVVRSRLGTVTRILHRIRNVYFIALLTSLAGLYIFVRSPLLVSTLYST